MSPAQSSPLKPKRRRWLQFSLRTMLLGTVVFALLFGWLGETVRRAWRQQRAVEEIVAIGGEVWWEDPENPKDRGRAWQHASADAPPGAEWLQRLLGEHFSVRATEVYIPPGADDEDLAWVDYLPDLTRLRMPHATVTDAGLKHVWRQKSLVKLYLRANCVDDDQIAHIESFGQLEELDLTHTAVSDRAVEVLMRLPNLKRLEIGGTHITVRGAERLSHMATKEASHKSGHEGYHRAAAPSERQRKVAVALERRGAEVTARRKSGDEETEYSVSFVEDWPMPVVDEELLDLLEDLDALRSLGFHKVPVTTEQWRRIAGGTAAAPGDGAGLMRLTDLAYGRVPLSSADVQQIGRLVHLETLGLGQIPDGSLAHLAPLQNLKRLGLDASQITDANYVHFTALRDLEDVHLDAQRLIGDGLAHLGALRNLKRLTLYAPSLTDAGLVHLERMSRLEDLDLYVDGITSAGLKHVGTLTNLESLRLSTAKTDDAWLFHLTRLKKLETLIVHQARTSDAGCVPLAGFKNLRELRIHECHITDAGFAHLTTLENLTVLHVWGANVTDTGLQELTRLSNLTDLDLGGTRVTQGGFRQLVDKLPNLESARVSVSGRTESFHFPD